MPRPNRGRQKVTLNLSPDLFQAVKDRAHQQGLHPADIIEQAVRKEIPMGTITSDMPNRAGWAGWEWDGNTGYQNYLEDGPLGVWGVENEDGDPRFTVVYAQDGVNYSEREYDDPESAMHQAEREAEALKATRLAEDGQVWDGKAVAWVKADETVRA